MEEKKWTTAPEILKNTTDENVTKIDKDHIKEEEIIINPEILENFGPWILPTRCSHRVQNNIDFHPKESSLTDKGKPNKPSGPITGRISHTIISYGFGAL